jgi:peptidyl-prolyl cis-trans isomerase C
MSKYRLLAAVAVVALLSAPAFAGDDTVVARVNGKAITQADVMHEMGNLPPQLQQAGPKAIAPKIIEQLVLARMLADAGTAEKIQNDAEVKRRVKQAEDRIVADTYLRRKVEPQVTDAALKARYDKEVASIKPQDEVRASHILVASEDEAKDIIKKLSGGANFADLAKEKSTDKGSAAQGGDLNFFTEGEMVKPFSEAAFGMKVGEVSKTPIKTDFGWHVIKVVDRRPAKAPTFEQAKPQLQQQMAQEAAQKVINGLKDKTKIEVFQWDGSPLPAEPKATDKK